MVSPRGPQCPGEDRLLGGHCRTGVGSLGAMTCREAISVPTGLRARLSRHRYTSLLFTGIVSLSPT